MREQTMLLVSREEARAKLERQIEQGMEKNTSSGYDLGSGMSGTSYLINTPRGRMFSSDKGKSFKRYRLWSDYNRTLLKQIFSTDEVEKEYSKVINNETHLLSFSDRYADAEIEVLESILERLELYPEWINESKSHITPTHINQDIDKSKVFIVHGHDDLAKTEVARLIESLGFGVIILHEQVSQGQTIIEKIEHYSDVGFGVVLYTSCDVGAAQTNPKNLQGRARQNVVFEHGFLIGKLGRKNVAALVKGDIEKPNDISGVVYISMEDEGWKYNLAKELKAAGYDVDMNKI